MTEIKTDMGNRYWREEMRLGNDIYIVYISTHYGMFGGEKNKENRPRKVK